MLEAAEIIGEPPEALREPAPSGAGAQGNAGAGAPATFADFGRPVAPSMPRPRQAIMPRSGGDNHRRSTEVSAVGAGDASLAGGVYAWLKAIRRRRSSVGPVAAGTATAGEDGTAHSPRWRGSREVHRAGERDLVYDGFACPWSLVEYTLSFVKGRTQMTRRLIRERAAVSRRARRKSSCWIFIGACRRSVSLRTRFTICWARTSSKAPRTFTPGRRPWRWAPSPPCGTTTDHQHPSRPRPLSRPWR